MRHYYLKLPGRISGPFPESELETMFLSGAISISTQCRRDGAASWSDLDEMFPLLKYGASLQGGCALRPPTSNSGWILAAITGSVVAAGALFFGFAGLFRQSPDPSLQTSPALTLAAPANPIPARRTIVTPQVGSANPIQSWRTPSPATVRTPTQTPRPVAQIQPEDPVATRQPTVIPLAQRRRAAEFQVPIYQWANMANFGGPDLSYKITQVSPAAIFIQWGRTEKPVRYEKMSGFEGNNYTPIIAVTGGTLYLVDSLRSSPGKRIFVVD